MLNHQLLSNRSIRKDRMSLYKHAARCPWTIQLFLQYNPSYWRFIPVTINEAMQHDRNYVLPKHLILHDNVNPTSIGSRNRYDIQKTQNTRSDEQVRTCMRQIPPLPTGYTFSIRQRIEQFQYFKNLSDTKVKLNGSIDLFNVAVIAVCKYHKVVDIVIYSF